MATFPMILSDP